MLIITKEKGVQDICNALEAHGHCSDLVDAACSALWSLSMEGRERERERERDYRDYSSVILQCHNVCMCTRDIYILTLDVYCKVCMVCDLGKVMCD